MRAVVRTSKGVKGLTLSLVVSVAIGCLEVQYGAGGAGGEGAGAGPTAGSSAGAGSSTGGAGGFGGVACAPAMEVCNGLDDDCNGVADEPESGFGDACGCTWLTLGSRLYAACDAMGDFDTIVCPLGTDLAVLGSPDEQAALFELIPLPDSALYLGLRQDDDASHPAVGWRWVGRDGPRLITRDGPLPPWSTGQPNDRAPTANTEPVYLEDGQENCGFLFRTPSGAETMTDGACVGLATTRALCEQQPDDCVSGATCRGELGCPGLLDCSKPQGQRCVAAPQTESCNGFDDNCDGALDDDVCGCVAFTDPSGRAYKSCTASLLIESAPCGAGFRLAMPETLEERAFLSDNAPLAGEGFHIGLLQPLGSPSVAADWSFLDGTPLGTVLWTPSEPNDGDVDPEPVIEDDEQNCARLTNVGLRDAFCDLDTGGFFCEEIP
jgi:hypothetical protein